MKKIALIVLGLNLIFIHVNAQKSTDLKIAGIKGSAINIEEMIERPITSIKSSDKVISFIVTVEIDKKQKSFYSKGNRFSDEFIQASQNLISGSKISFDSVVVKQIDKQIIIPSFNYIIKRESPQAYIGNHRSVYEMSIAEILNQPFLNCSNRNIKVSTFNVVICKNERVQRFENKSEKFSTEIIGAISQLIGGETVWFENINGVVESKVVPLPPFKISILGSNEDYPCTLAGISFGEWDTKLLPLSTEIKVPSKNVIIESFMMYALINDEYKSFRQTSGSKLTSEMIEFLKQVKPGTVVKIDYIRASIEDVSLKLNPIYLKIAGNGNSLTKSVLGNLSFGVQSADYIKNNKITFNNKPVNYFIVRTLSENVLTSLDGNLTESQSQQLSQYPKGTILQFYNISVIESGKRVKLDDIWIKIK